MSSLRPLDWRGAATALLLSALWGALASPAAESGTPTRYTVTLATSLLSQGAVVAGFNFIVSSYLYRVYRASAIATCSLTTPLFGVLIAAAVTRETLSPLLLLSSLTVAAGIGLTVRR